jgi:uncharacterized integral membrane protein
MREYAGMPRGQANDGPLPERPDEGRPTRPGPTAAEVRWIGGGLLAVLFGIFVAQNADPVRVDFLFFSASIRLIWVFLICAALGVAIDRLLQRRGVLPPPRVRARRQREIS